MIRTRKNVYTILKDPNDKTLYWYDRAIEVMLQRKLNDPLGWRYQAAIHDYPGAAADPYRERGLDLPSASDQKKFWKQCEHGSWYFIPWHRMYLYQFEQIVAWHVANLDGGPKDWTLPYWNYSESDDSRVLPPPFRQKTRGKDGTPNFLYVEQRSRTANSGETFDKDAALLTGCLDQPQYSGRPSFGGGESPRIHYGRLLGALEGTPHGTMHNQVGGTSEPGGWMSDLATAALDPIFWLHHANIDRLWEVWLARDSSHKNPTKADWLTKVSFDFNRIDPERGEARPVQMTVAEVVDALKLQYPYKYEDISDPLPKAVARAFSAIAGAQTVESEIMPELLGATPQGIELDGTMTHAAVPIHVAAKETFNGFRAAQAFAAPGDAETERAVLLVEHITGSQVSCSYKVYLVPPGEDPANHPDAFIGSLAMFGLVETSRVDDNHSGEGLTYAFDITDHLPALAARSGWDPNHLHVTLVPYESGRKTRVVVGRISVFSE